MPRLVRATVAVYTRATGAVQRRRSEGSTGMPKVVITHGVQGVPTWLKGKEERAAAIGGMGGSDVVDHVAQDGAPSVAITFSTDDLDAVMATLAAPPPDVLDAMQRHGVVPPLITYVEK